MEELGPLPGLRGKTALVVGGGLGIGLSTARMLAGQGVRLALVDMDAERVKAASDELSALGLCADVRAAGAARAAVSDAVTQLGRLDILVNIVGRGNAGPTVDLSAEVQRAVLETNFLHHVEFCSAFAQAAIADGRPGVITMVSSLAGLVPFPKQAAYGAAKAALNSYTSSLAVELGPQPILDAANPNVLCGLRKTASRKTIRELGMAEDHLPLRGRPSFVIRRGQAEGATTGRRSYACHSQLRI